jgi:hypothetical protein
VLTDSLRDWLAEQMGGIHKDYADSALQRIAKVWASKDAEFPTAVATDNELNPLPDAAPGTVVTITIVGLDIKFRDTLIVKSDTIWTPRRD